MAKNKTLSTRISPEVEQFLIDQYGTASAGLAACADELFRVKRNGFNPAEASESLQFLKQIRLYSMRELKGRLSPEEWCYLADSLNGTTISPEFRANNSGLIASVEDSNDFDGLAQKWEVDISSFLEKIKTLTGAQVDAVYTRVEQFWDNDSHDLEVWAKEL